VTRAERNRRGATATNVRLTKELNDKLNAYAKATKVSKAEAMRKGALIYYTLVYNHMEVTVDDNE
jgi:hypothetical protein